VSSVRQQINLYQPSAPVGSGPFSASGALVVAVIVGACLFAFWGYGLWRVAHLEHAVESLEQQHQRGDDTLAALGAAQGAGKTPEQAQTRVSELTTELATRTRALQLLQGGTVGQIVGFSPRLVALAHRPVHGLWIDHVVLSGITGSMSVGGAAVDPDLVPLYLHGLSAERALAGARFDEFVIERPSSEHAGEPSGAVAAPAVQQQSFRFRADSGALRAPPATEKPT
jgi:hypothetical protein